MSRTETPKKKPRKTKPDPRPDMLEALPDCFPDAVLDEVQDGVIILNDHLETTFINRFALDLFKLRREDVLHKNLFETFPEAKDSVFEERYKQAVETKTFDRFNVYFGVAPYENRYDVRVHPVKGGVAVMFHVSPEDRIDERLRLQSEDKYRDLFELATDGICLQDDEGRFVECNPAFASLLGLTPTELVGRSIFEFITPEDIAKTPPQIERIKKGHVVRVDRVLRRPDGGAAQVEISARMIGRGRVQSIVRDISRRKKLECDLLRLAGIDALTKVFNRGFFGEIVNRELKRAARHGLSLSLLMLDLDHFKEINDTLGHPAGDACLKGFVKICRDTLRGTDYLGRVGGEEFCALLPQTLNEEAMRAAVRIKNRTAAEPFLFEDRPIPLTVSIGGVSASEEDRDFEGLLKKADAALYDAKRAGRNAVRFFG